MNETPQPFGQTPEFIPFPKMARLSREVILTEKIDGTNASVYIIKPEVDIINFTGYVAEVDGHLLYAGSRNRWVTPSNDNHGFAKWVFENAVELIKLGPGRHFGEWWGSGIQRGYGLTKGEKRFSLFNTVRWCEHNQEPHIIPTGDPRIVKMQEVLPACVSLVPVIHKGMMNTDICDFALGLLKEFGSKAAPGFKNPEGIVVYHTASGVCYKKTLDQDEIPKSLQI